MVPLACSADSVLALIMKSDSHPRRIVLWLLRLSCTWEHCSNCEAFTRCTHGTFELGCLTPERLGYVT
jgi:hypothetical protein